MVFNDCPALRCLAGVPVSLEEVGKRKVMWGEGWCMQLWGGGSFRAMLVLNFGVPNYSLFMQVEK